MSDPRSTNPYTSSTSAVRRDAAGRAAGRRARDPGRRADAQAFLTQAFVWMFVGLGVTAGDRLRRPEQ